LQLKETQLKTVGRILAIDYGVKRCGIAVTDPLQIIAGGLATVETVRIMDFLTSYATREIIDAIVVGYPLNLDGSATHATPLVERFCSKVQKALPGIAIHREDERFTSKMATQAMLEGGLKKMARRDKAMVDKTSAVIILQSYMEKENT
jgi:putative Holliday junction resolvase